MFLLLAILCIFICWPVYADPETATSLSHTTNSTVSAEEGDQSEEGESTEEKNNGPDFKEVVKGFAHIEGLFDLHLDAEENKVYLALEPEQFDKIYLRNLQRAHLKKVIGVVINMASDAPEDARSLARIDLQTIIVGSQTALARPSLDAYTQAQTQAAFNAGLNLQQF